jgi:hypothetical protein
VKDALTNKWWMREDEAVKRGQESDFKTYPALCPPFASWRVNGRGPQPTPKAKSLADAHTLEAVPVDVPPDVKPEHDSEPLPTRPAMEWTDGERARIQAHLEYYALHGTNPGNRDAKSQRWPKK